MRTGGTTSMYAEWEQDSSKVPTLEDFPEGSVNQKMHSKGIIFSTQEKQFPYYGPLSEEVDDIQG